MYMWVPGEYEGFTRGYFIWLLHPSVKQMRIRGISVRVPPLLFAVTVFFAAMCAMMYGSSQNPMYVYLAVPLCIILIGVPLGMNYLTEKQILEQIPAMKTRAKFVRARQVSSAMTGVPVILEGKVLKVTGLLMNKPSYLLMDGTGQIVIRRFALPDPLIGVGAQVEVLGTVMHKLTNSDAVYVSAVTIRPIRHLRSEEEKAEEEAPKKETVRIKKLP